MNDAAFAGTMTIYFTSACAGSTWPFSLMTGGGEHPRTPSSAGAAPASHLSGTEGFEAAA